MVDLVIKNGKVVTVRGIFEAGVAIDEGKIVAVAKEPNLPPADRIIDAKGHHILPGIIEPHAHLGINEPYDFKQEVLTETAAAASGGITTFMHMLYDKRSYTVAVPETTEICNSRTHVDMAFNATIMNEQHINEIEGCVKLGVTAFKHYMNRPEYENIGILHPDDGMLLTSFEKIQAAGGIAKTHCENYEIIRKTMERVRASGRTELAAWDDSRPDYCEQDHLRRAAFMAKVTGVPIYVVHTTVGGHREVVDWARREGVEIYIETCTSYLTHTRDSKIGVLGKIQPPLRSQKHQDVLWESVKDGYIDCIGTDHCAIGKEKKLGQGDIWSAWAGFPGSEMMLPLMLSEGFHKRNVPLERIVEICSYNTANVHGLPNKGDVRVGYDGDLVIVDLNKKVKISQDILHGRSDFSLYEGWEITGWPTMTILRGEVIAEEGEIVGKPGFGRVIRCIPHNLKKSHSQSSYAQ